MKRKKIAQLALKLSNGFFSTATDLVLWNIFYSIEISPLGCPTNLRKAKIKADQDLKKFNSSTVERAIRRLKEKGYIKQDLTPTKKGKERLKSIFPESYENRKWNGNWHLVIYDIPRSKNRCRDILRENLKKLKFGQLQNSVWISPFNFLGDVRQIIEEYNLSPYVILAITDKLGTEKGRVLAKKVWPLDEINESYRKILKKIKENDQSGLYLDYLSVFNRDPQLPKQLLPEDWVGEETHRLFLDFKENLQ